MTQKTFNPPAIFDQFGNFQEWPERVLEQAPPLIAEAYDEVHLFADDLAVVEYEIAETEKSLHAAVAELRTVEHEISKAYKPTQKDLLRAVQETEAAERRRH
jgi:hypothetical protein